MDARIAARRAIRRVPNCGWCLFHPLPTFRLHLNGCPEVCKEGRSPCTELWVVLPVSLHFRYWLVSVRKHCYCQHYRLGPRGGCGASPDTTFTHLSHKVADPLICNSSISGCMLRGDAWSARSLSCTPPLSPPIYVTCACTSSGWLTAEHY